MRRSNPELRKIMGEPEDPLAVAAARQHSREYYEGKEPDLEMEFLRDQIDWQFLRDQFQSLAEQSGAEIGEVNQVEGKHVYFDPNQPNAALYNSRTNFIAINPASVRGAVSRWEVPAPFVLTHIAAHEQTHAASRNECEGLFEGSPDMSLRSGLGFADAEKKYFTFLDEGVTEKLGRQIAAEYIRAHPGMGTAKETSKYLNHLDDDSFTKPYDMLVSLAEAVIAKIAHETGVSSETVWQAVVREKLEGTLDRSELKRVLSEALAPEVVAKIEQSDNATSRFKILPLIKSLGIVEIAPEIWQRAVARFDAASRENAARLKRDTA